MNSKICFLPLCALLGSGLFAAEEPQLKFDGKIEIPALSLLQGAKEGARPLVGDSARIVRKETSRPQPARPTIAQLPVVTPSDEADYKLRIVAPDDAVDHKLVIKSPDRDGSR